MSVINNPDSQMEALDLKPSEYLPNDNQDKEWACEAAGRYEVGTVACRVGP